MSEHPITSVMQWATGDTAPTVCVEAPRSCSVHQRDEWDVWVFVMPDGRHLWAALHFGHCGGKRVAPSFRVTGTELSDHDAMTAANAAIQRGAL